MKAAALTGALTSTATGNDQPPPSPVDFTGDGIPLRPAEYAALLARLAAEGRAGEDDYSRGGAVQTLEDQFARLLGKEAAIFMPTGTLANHLAVRALS
jgi:threonine aldolase